jgi:hypothetical protein
LGVAAHITRLPTGTISFLFSDIEGSTRLLARLRGRYADLLDEHRRLLRKAALCLPVSTDESRWSSRMATPEPERSVGFHPDSL